MFKSARRPGSAGKFHGTCYRLGTGGFEKRLEDSASDLRHVYNLSCERHAGEISDPPTDPASMEIIHTYFQYLRACVKAEFRRPHAWDAVRAIAQALLEHERLSYEQVLVLIAGEAA
jgi:hypothetical protein